MIEILRVIGARSAGDPKVGAKEGCTKLISNSAICGASNAFAPSARSSVADPLPA
jgi:hypothetical protein